MKHCKAWIALLILAGAGCSHPAGAPPPSPNQFLKHIQDNPNMPPEQKAAMMQTIRGHQESGQMAGAARQKRVPNH